MEYIVFSSICFLSLPQLRMCTIQTMSNIIVALFFLNLHFLQQLTLEVQYAFCYLGGYCWCWKINLVLYMECSFVMYLRWVDTILYFIRVPKMVRFTTTIKVKADMQNCVHGWIVFLREGKKVFCFL